VSLFRITQDTSAGASTSRRQGVIRSRQAAGKERVTDQLGREYLCECQEQRQVGGRAILATPADFKQWPGQRVHRLLAVRGLAPDKVHPGSD
ncbi:hypothetical protein, partial [Klebsiella variicola]|uniref:hypothetical protein n=1 Tax=Klebsiella variicola TaxID=244366 RepID=UPI00272FB873